MCIKSWVPLWHYRLRFQHCHCSGLGHYCGRVWFLPQELPYALGEAENKTMKTNKQNLTFFSVETSRFIYWFYFFIYILKLYWGIVDLQCVINFYCTTKWFSYMYTHIHSFSDSFPIEIFTEYWVEFPALHSRAHWPVILYTTALPLKYCEWFKHNFF